MPATTPSVTELLAKVPTGARPSVRAARRTVRAIAPKATETAYGSRKPQSKSAMWKLVRYAVNDAYVVGIGTFATYAWLFFYRGRELDDDSGLLEGSGKQMRSIKLRTPADAARPAVKRMLRKAFELEK